VAYRLPQTPTQPAQIEEFTRIMRGTAYLGAALVRVTLGTANASGAARQSHRRAESVAAGRKGAWPEDRRRSASIAFDEDTDPVTGVIKTRDLLRPPDLKAGR
jgi:hypothetical protein